MKHLIILITILLSGTTIGAIHAQSVIKGYVIDEKTGEIISFISGSNSHFAFFKEPKRKEIMWKHIKKIGSDMIIIENE